MLNPEMRSVGHLFLGSTFIVLTSKIEITAIAWEDLRS